MVAVLEVPSSPSCDPRYREPIKLTGKMMEWSNQGRHKGIEDFRHIYSHRVLFKIGQK